MKIKYTTIPVSKELAQYLNIIKDMNNYLTFEWFFRVKFRKEIEQIKKDIKNLRRIK